VTVTRFFGHPTNRPTAAKILMRESRAEHDEANRVVFSKSRLFVDSGQVFNRAASLDTDSSDAAFVTVTTTFDANSLVVRTSVPNNDLGPQVTRISYDGNKRLRVHVDPKGNKGESEYNGENNRVKTTETDTTSTGLVSDETFTRKTIYDAIGRPIVTIDPLGHTRRDTYGTQFLTSMTDAVGAPIAGASGEVNAPGNRTEYRRDGLGRVVRGDRHLTTTGVGGGPLDTSNPANPDGKITVRHKYLDAIRKHTQTDDRGNATTTTRDTRNNVVRVDWADGTVSSTDYNLDDDPVTINDQSGNVITQQHDPLGRLFLRTIARASGVVGTTRQEFGHDGLSRVSSTRDISSDFTSTFGCAYDSFGNKLEEVHNGRVVSMRYKSFRDPVSCAYPDGTVVGYSTDKLDRLTDVSEGGDSAADFKYLGTWRLLERNYGNGTKMKLHDSGASTYDRDRRLTGLEHTKGRKLVSDFTAAYNNEDYITAMTRTHLSGTDESIGLDSVYRVKDYTDGARNKETFDLDGVGNWTKQVINGATNVGVANNMNEYTLFGGASQTHDDNGNRLTDGRFNYAWDFANRLTEVRTTGGQLVALYGYHVDGRRTFKEVFEVDATEGNGNNNDDDDGGGDGGEEGGKKGLTRFACSGYRMIEESDREGRATARTVFGRGFELVKRTDLTRGGNKGQSIFYHEDIKGWIETVTKRKGQVGERYGYSAYGKVRFFDKDGEERGRATVKNQPWLYHGYFRDEETGLYYTVHRYHDPQTGRWLSRDPLGYHDGMGLYEFVRGSPVGQEDPDGQASLTGTAAAALAKIVAACGLPYFIYASKNFTWKKGFTDKFQHCWVSCRMSRTCGGALTILTGLSWEGMDLVAKGILGGLRKKSRKKEFAASLRDIIANKACVGWESYFGLAGAWAGAIIRESCYKCCKRKYPKRKYP